MKISIFSNDKTTMKDEIILSIIVILALILGLLFIYLKPNVWIIQSSSFVVLGVMLLLFSVMMVPSIVVRFITNNKINRGDK